MDVACRQLLIELGILSLGEPFEISPLTGGVAGEKPGERVVISLDIAASEFGSNGKYRLALDERELSSDGFIDLLGGWLDAYPIVSIEDPLGEDDRHAMIEFTRRFGN